MRVSRLAVACLGLTSLFCGVGAASAQEVKPPATLWTFLGFPPKNTIRDDLTNRNGNRPGLERKPPRLAIADPKNLKSPVPAIKKAAEVKTQEDLAPQKIKAIKYLASIGCGCYNRDGSITEALLAALDDCTETVRLAAADAIYDSAAGDVCQNCGEHSCCSKEIHDRLMKMAYDTNKEGCLIEPSDRVRRAAMRALLVCPPHDEMERVPELPPIQPETPPEPLPPTAAPLPPAASTPTPADPRLIPAAEIRIETRPQPSTQEIRQLPKSSRRTAQQGRLPVNEVASHQEAEPRVSAGIPSAEGSVTLQISSNVEESAAVPEQAAPVIVHKAVVEYVDLAKRLVVVRTGNDGQLPSGATVLASHNFLTGPAVIGQLKVVASEPGFATLQPLNGMQVTRVARGDQVNVTR